MQTTIEVATVFETSIERAFKTPMLCDVAKVHSDYGTPKITHCIEDENWGKIGGSRKVFVEKFLTFKGGEGLLDKVLERKENQYWKIEVSNFKFWMLGFEKFQGEWTTTQLQDNKVQILYRYTMFSNNTLLYPFQWLFTKTAWRIHMKHVMENIRQLANNNAPYLYQ